MLIAGKYHIHHVLSDLYNKIFFIMGSVRLIGFLLLNSKVWMIKPLL